MNRVLDNTTTLAAYSSVDFHLTRCCHLQAVLQTTIRDCHLQLRFSTPALPQRFTTYVTLALQLNSEILVNVGPNDLLRSLPVWAVLSRTQL